MSHSLQVFCPFVPPTFFPMSLSICIQLLRGSAHTAEALNDSRGGRRWSACSAGGLRANNRCVTATSPPSSNQALWWRGSAGAQMAEWLGLYGCCCEATSKEINTSSSWF